MKFFEYLKILMDGWGAADLKTWKVQRTESTQKLIIIFAFASDEAIW